MTINYDFNEASEGGDFVTLDAGRYIFELVKIVSEESAAGNPIAVVTLMVVAATGANEIYEGGVITQHMNTTGKAAFRFRDVLAALRVKSSKSGKINLKKFYGKEIGAVVSVRPSDDGELTFNDLKGIVPGDQMRAILFPDDVDDDDDIDDDIDDDDVDVDVDDDVDDDDDDDDIDDDDDEGEVVTKEDLKGMSSDELKELAEEWDVSTRKPRNKDLTKGMMRKRLGDYIESQEEDTEEDDDNDDDDEEPF